MKHIITTVAITGLLALGTPVQAQEVRLPPSVGATPIEIPYIDPDAPRTLQMQPLDQGALRQAPSVATLPIPLPRQGIEQADPRRMPGVFSVLPLPLPGTARLGRVGNFTFATLPDGTIYGDTNFGYARFANTEAYHAFLRSH